MKWIDMTLKVKMIISFVVVYVVLYIGMSGYMIKDILIMQDDMKDIKQNLAHSKLMLEQIEIFLDEGAKISSEPMETK